MIGALVGKFDGDSHRMEQRPVAPFDFIKQGLDFLVPVPQAAAGI